MVQQAHTLTMPRLISVIDRYVLRELIAPLWMSGALLTFFLLIDRIYNLTDLVITKGVPLHLVMQLLVFMMPSFLALTLPMALLVAVLLAGGRLAGDLEVVAFQASGVGPLRLFSPVFAVALAVAMVAGALTIVIGPPANREFQAQLFKILQARATSGLKERVFNADFGDIVIYPEEISASQVALRGLLVSDERDPRLTRIITAREGRLLSDEVNRRITLRLIDGAVNEADVLPAMPLPGESDTLAPTPKPPADETYGGAAAPGRYRHTLFGIYDMSLPIDVPLRGAARFEKPEKDLSLAQIEEQIEGFAGQPFRRAPFAVEWHKRFAFPLAALVFVLVGFPLAVRSHRGGRAIALIGSLTILTSYYLLLTTLESAALRTRIPAWVAIWTPNALFGTAGVALMVMVVRDVRWRGPRWIWSLSFWLDSWRRRPALAERDREHAGPSSDSTHILDRYLLRSHVTFMLVGLAVAAALFVVVDLAQTLDRFLRVKPHLAYILEHFAYRLPAWLHDGLPIVMLVATIFLFLTLTRYHELTALKAAGISLYRISAPIIILGLGVAIAAGLFQELVLPQLNERGDEVDRVKIRGQLPRHMQSRARLWLRSADSRFYRVELLAPGTADLYGVTILEVGPDFRLLSRLDARRAHWTGDTWEMKDGAFREARPDGQIESVPFTVTALNLDERIEDFTQIQKPVAAMSYVELSDYVRKLESAGFHAKKYLVELYAKLAFPLVNLIMVLVAIPFALQAPRSTRLVGVGLAIVIMVCYVVVHQAAVALARADLLPPVLAAWTANVIFLGLGLSLFVRART
jgi:lipopolysaccharide export system permease protein